MLILPSKENLQLLHDKDKELEEQINVLDSQLEQIET